MKLQPPRLDRVAYGVPRDGSCRYAFATLEKGSTKLREAQSLSQGYRLIRGGLPYLRLRFRFRLWVAVAVAGIGRLQQPPDDPQRLHRLDLFGSLLLDQFLEGGHDEVDVIMVEIPISVVYGDIVFAGEAMDRAVPPPGLLLFEVSPAVVLHLSEVCRFVFILEIAADERLEVDDVVLHGCLRCCSSVVDGP